MPFSGVVSWLTANDKPVRRGFTRVRIALLATDAEWENLKAVREEVEHALEPPTPNEGFFARKWDTLTNPHYALDVTRSFQNLARLMRVSAGFPSPWIREFLASAITMFSLTHGSEMVTGALGSVYFLLHGNAAAAGAWLGLALPGLYDFGCYIGAGVLFVRPTRDAFNTGRKAVFSLAGAAARKMGLPATMSALFAHSSAREQLLLLMRQPGADQRLELEILDSELLSLHLLDNQGQQFAHLHLRETSAGELALESAVLSASLMPGDREGMGRLFPNTELRRLTRGLGWNLRGALLTLSRLIRNERTHLIEHEKTFVESAEIDGDTIRIQFRPNAVALSTWGPSPEPAPCPQALQQATQAPRL